MRTSVVFNGQTGALCTTLTALGPVRRFNSPPLRLTLS